MSGSVWLSSSVCPSRIAVVANEIAAAISGQSTPCCVGECIVEEQRCGRWDVGVDHGWIMLVGGAARLWRSKAD